MSVVNNTCSEIGDILEINSQVIFNGTVVGFTGFTDVLVGETVDRYFDKIFRLTLDGVNWTDWEDLTIPNISSKSGRCDGIALFEFKYTRAGTVTTGLLEFTSINITAIATGLDCTENKPITSQSIFKDLCSETLAKELCNNLFKKLYKKGIIPNYIERGEGGVEDEDYIAFWKSIGCYFSLFVVFAIKFEKINQRKEYLSEYLTQKGLYFSQSNVSLEDLQYLSNYFLDEIRKRGTILITKTKGTLLNDGTLMPVDGELLRLLCYESTNEFLFEIMEDSSMGWCMNESSPSYVSTNFSKQLQKMPEKTDDILDLSLYNLTNTGYMTLITDGDKEVLNITNVANTFYSGIGWITPPALSQGMINKFIKIDMSVDYEITFWIKRVSSSVGKVYFGLNAIDSFDNIIPDVFEEMVGGTDSNVFFNDGLFQFDNWYFVRGIIYAKNSTLQSADDMKLNINRGVNLRFKEGSDIKGIYPTIGVDNTASLGLPNGYNIWGLGMRPLSRGKNILTLTTGEKPQVHSNCFLETKNMIYSWYKNNNDRYNDDEVEEIIKKFLIPYNSTINAIKL